MRLMFVALSCLCFSVHVPQTFAAGSQATANVAPSEGEELVTRYYDLSGLRVPGDGGHQEGVLVLPIRRAGHNTEDDQRHEEDRMGYFSTLIQEVFAQELEYEDRFSMIDDSGILAIHAPEALHVGVQGLLEYYSGLLNAHSLMRVDVVQSDAADTSLAALCTPEEADAWIEGQRSKGHVHTYQLQVPYSSVASFRQQTSRELLTSVHAQIAQSVVSLEEVTSPTLSGTWGTLSAKPQKGGVAITMNWVQSEEPKVQPLELKLSAMIGSLNERVARVLLGGVLHISDQTAQAACLSGVLPDGQVMVSGMYNAAVPMGTTILVRRLPTQSPKMRYIMQSPVQGEPATHFQAISRAAVQKQRLQWENHDGGPLPTAYNLFEAVGLWVHTQDSELFDYAMESRNEDLVYSLEDGQLVILWTDRESESFASASATQIAELDALTAKSQAFPIPKRTFSVRMLMRHRGAEPVVIGQQCVEQGSKLFVLQGKEKSEISGFDVEVAQNSSVQVPEVGLFFEGLMASIQVNQLGAGQLRVALDGYYNEAVSHSKIDSQSPNYEAYRRTVYKKFDLVGSKVLSEAGTGVWRGEWGGQGDGMTSLILEIKQL